MDSISLHTIVEYAAGELRQGDAACMVSGITTDSRAVGPGELFLALQGDNYDGHHFIGSALEKGAVGAVVSKGFVDSLPPDAAIVVVPNTLSAYQRIAARYRRSLPMKVVAITGSNGKTSTKDLTAAVLGGRYRVLKTSGNYNNHVGVPQTLLRASVEDDFAVLEIGMNHAGEIAPLAMVAKPDVAVITNVGTAHIEFLKTRAAIAQEKGALAEAVEASGHVVLPAEDKFAASIGERTLGTKVLVGFARGDIRAEKIQMDETGTRFTMIIGGERLDAYLPIPGKHMVLNGLFAVAVGKIYGLSSEECVTNLATAALTKGRLQFKNVCGLRILDDSYNANPDSMVAALETLARLPVKGRRIAVLGRMGELGLESAAGHRRVGEAAGRERIDELVAVGTEAELIVEGAREAGVAHARRLAGVEEAAAWIHDSTNANDLILIKGSRSAGMERIITLLSSKHLTPEEVL